MPLSSEDKSYLWDLKEAATDIIEFTKGKNYETFTRDKIIRFAVERQLLVVGEVSKQLSAEFKNSQPGILWQSVILSYVTLNRLTLVGEFANSNRH